MAYLCTNLTRLPPVAHYLSPSNRKLKTVTAQLSNYFTPYRSSALRKVAYTAIQHTARKNPKVSRASDAPVIQVRKSAMLLLLMQGIKKYE
jgi:hypothetical protein